MFAVGSAGGRLHHPGPVLGVPRRRHGAAVGEAEPGGGDKAASASGGAAGIIPTVPSPRHLVQLPATAPPLQPTHKARSASSCSNRASTSGPVSEMRLRRAASSSSTRWYSICEQGCRGGHAAEDRARRHRRCGARSDSSGVDRCARRSHLVAPLEDVVLARLDAVEDVQELEDAMLADCGAGGARGSGGVAGHKVHAASSCHADATARGQPARQPAFRVPLLTHHRLRASGTPPTAGASPPPGSPSRPISRMEGVPHPRYRRYSGCTARRRPAQSHKQHRQRRGDPNERRVLSLSAVESPQRDHHSPRRHGVTSAVRAQRIHAV